MNENSTYRRDLVATLALAVLALALLAVLILQVAPQLLPWMPLVLIGGAPAQYALWKGLR